MKGEALNVRRVSAQMSAVAQKLKSAERTKQISHSIKRSVPIIQKGLKEMDSLGINKAMSEFDQVMEDLDIKTDSLNSGLEGVYASTIDQKKVDQLMDSLKEAQVTDMQSKFRCSCWASFFLDQAMHVPRGELREKAEGKVFKIPLKMVTNVTKSKIDYCMIFAQT